MVADDVLALQHGKNSIVRYRFGTFLHRFTIVLESADGGRMHVPNLVQYESLSFLDCLLRYAVHDDVSCQLMGALYHPHHRRSTIDHRPDPIRQHRNAFGSDCFVVVPFRPSVQVVEEPQEDPVALRPLSVEGSIVPKLAELVLDRFPAVMITAPKLLTLVVEVHATARRQVPVLLHTRLPAIVHLAAIDPGLVVRVERQQQPVTVSIDEVVLVAGGIFRIPARSGERQVKHQLEAEALDDVSVASEIVLQRGVAEGRQARVLDLVVLHRKQEPEGAGAFIALVRLTSDLFSGGKRVKGEEVVSGSHAVSGVVDDGSIIFQMLPIVNDYFSSMPCSLQAASMILLMPTSTSSYSPWAQS